MKKALIWIVVLIIIVAGIFVIRAKRSPQSETDNNPPVPVVPVSETTQVSNKTKEYQNAELGFSVKYPTAWEKEETSSGVTFIIPIDQTQVSTISKLQADIAVTPGKCAFPPVTTVKDRGTVTAGTETLNMISIQNTVQSRVYFNRMYSLQKGSVCYLFTLSTITSSPASKNISGSQKTQAENNNKAIINTTDAAFTDMVKSFGFVSTPEGKDETQAAPKK